jgi:hypothetical protein
MHSFVHSFVHAFIHSFQSPIPHPGFAVTVQRQFWELVKRRSLDSLHFTWFPFCLSACFFQLAGQPWQSWCVLGAIDYVFHALHHDCDDVPPNSSNYKPRQRLHVSSYLFILLLLVILLLFLGTSCVVVLSAAFLVFMSIAVVPSFIEDRAIFTRERANGYYHVCQIPDSVAFRCIGWFSVD